MDSFDISTTNIKTMALPHTKYSWVGDLKTKTFLANSRESVRVMGVVTGIGDFTSDSQSKISPTRSSEAQYRSNIPEERTFPFTIDDGTDSIDLWAPRRFIESIPSAPTVEVGETYDFILTLRQKCEVKRWFVEIAIHIDNPFDEHFRWLELCHHNRSLSQSSSSGVRYSNLCHKFGFPTRRRNNAEVYRLISIHSQLQQEQQDDKTKSKIPATSKKSFQKRIRPKWAIKQSIQPKRRQRGLQTSSTMTNRNKAVNEKTKTISPQSSETPKPILVEGLSLNELATVLQKSERTIQEITEDLQLEGKIYQNERGEYLPL